MGHNEVNLKVRPIFGVHFFYKPTFFVNHQVFESTYLYSFFIHHIL